MSSPSRQRLLRCGFAAALFLAAPFARAQGGGALGADRSIPPTPTPVGSGARAAGMADAFIGIADDATAASWNPAGLVQLERPEISIVGAHFTLRDRLSASGDPEFNGDHGADEWDLNYLSAAWPLPAAFFGKNATISLNYQQKFDFTRSLGGDRYTTTYQPLTPPVFIHQLSRLAFDQEGSLSAISPAFAIELTHKLSVGVAFNIWRSSFLSDNGWTQTTRSDGLAFIAGTPFFSHSISKEEYSDFSGENLTLGLLWRLNSKWSFGARYDSAFTASARYDATDSVMGLFLVPPLAVPTFNFSSQHETRHIRFPATLAAGVAWRPNDRLTLALDASRTDWNDTFIKDARGEKFSLVDGTSFLSLRQKTSLEPVHTLRLGAEYTFIPKEPGNDLPQLWSIRGGLFYEEEPATNRSTRYYFTRGDGQPDQFYGAAIGAGVLLGQRFNLDIAYQIRTGPHVNHDLNPGVNGFNDHEIEHRFLLSTVIYF